MTFGQQVNIGMNFARVANANPDGPAGGHHRGIERANDVAKERNLGQSLIPQIKTSTKLLPRTATPDHTFKMRGLTQLALRGAISHFFKSP